MTRTTTKTLPSWEILERDDYDARYRPLMRRLLVWDFIRTTAYAMAGTLGIALAGSVLYAVCPEPIDLLIQTVAARESAAIGRLRLDSDKLPLGEAPEDSPWVR